jgi:membrane-bound metal-dependent hydrolase YbcI (DUF457 family)
MMGKTHKAGGCLAMLLAYQFMRKNNMLYADINPIVQLLIMYPACSWGSTAPDLDQNDNAIPEKTPVSILVHKLLYLGKVKHRSWQTHSLLVTGGFVALLFVGLHIINLYGLFGLNQISLQLLKLLLMGLAVGIASHLLLDMMTYEGIHSIPPTKNNGHWIRLVPHTDAFKTNTTYESIVRVLLYICCVLMLGYIIIKN